MCTEVCQWLLRVAQGVVVNALAQYDETILHIAGRMDHWEVIDMMQNPFGRALVVPGPKLADFGGIYSSTFWKVGGRSDSETYGA